MLNSLIHETKTQSSHGFSLLELLVALVVFVIGVLGVASLLVSGIHMQTLSRDATQASAFAEAKVEELRVIDFTDLQRSAGGVLWIATLPATTTSLRGPALPDAGNCHRGRQVLRI